MIADIMIALAAPIAGFFAALWLLLLCVGDKPAVEAQDDLTSILNPQDGMAGDHVEEPLIPMPAHLTTKDEMVAWMTKELPRLAGERPKPRI